ncbi:hypothetical protein AVEN_115165-1 [Araneus ventricosus]|uniref:Uncharacterized protein n=1 Tax=Araneus ventricosus TaxID=182803 RepID=A0A4Y1ZXI4_ARAVE|nr:hypothetical protein AVEN_115165-1 [Araneus ventricosus]
MAGNACIQNVVAKKRVGCSFCTLCYKNFSVASMGKSTVKSHAMSRKHIDLQSTRRTAMNIVGSYFYDKNIPESIHQPQHSPLLSAASSTSNIGNIESHVVKNDVLDAEIFWTLKTVKNHGSYKANEDIQKMFHRMFPDSAIATYKYRNLWKVVEILKKKVKVLQESRS